MPVDMSAVAAQAAKARGGTQTVVAQLPNTADEYIDELIEDSFLQVEQATALRLLIGKAKVEAVVEATKRAIAGAEPTASAEVAAEDTAADTAGEVVEDMLPDEVMRQAIAFDQEIERRRAHGAQQPDGPQTPAELEAEAKGGSTQDGPVDGND